MPQADSSFWMRTGAAPEAGAAAGRRAWGETARDALFVAAAGGAIGERITIEGKGEQSPVTGQDCSKLKGQKLIQCFEPDRRVEIEVFGEREVAATEGQQPGTGATSGGSAGPSSGAGR